MEHLCFGLLCVCSASGCVCVDVCVCVCDVEEGGRREGVSIERYIAAVKERGIEARAEGEGRGGDHVEWVKTDETEN